MPLGEISSFRDESNSTRRDATSGPSLADLDAEFSRARSIPSSIINPLLKKQKALYQDRELIRKSFLECGISADPCGTEDSLIKIKDIDSRDIALDGVDIKIEDSGYEMPAYLDLCNDEFIEGDVPQYSSMLVKDLRHLLKGRGLPVSGKKADLIIRLEGDDMI